MKSWQPSHFPMMNKRVFFTRLTLIALICLLALSACSALIQDGDREAQVPGHDNANAAASGAASPTAHSQAAAFGEPYPNLDSASGGPFSTEPYPAFPLAVDPSQTEPSGIVTPGSPVVPSTSVSVTEPPAAAEEMKFSRGATSAHIQKPIKSGERHIYTLSAQEGQTMILSAASPDNDVFLDVRGAQGRQQLLSFASGLSYWNGALPETQDYQISLTTDNADTYYSLMVVIPANIIFQPGSNSAQVNGYIAVDTDLHPGEMTWVSYLVYASAGQTMTTKLTSPNLDNLSMGIYGQQDGQPYVRFQVTYHGGELVLPTTQGYYLEVYAVNVKSTPFTLDVTIK